MNAMRVDKLDGQWWILSVPTYVVDGVTFDTCGPYPTRGEAQHDMRGMMRTYAELAKPASTSDPVPVEERVIGKGLLF